jgi:pyruvate,orthophosphate dikinase
MEATQSIATKWIYDFSEGSRELGDLLGGKGADIAEMARVLGSHRVPSGFTISTAAGVEYMRAGRVPPAELAEQVDQALARLEEQAGRHLGDSEDPLLVSVRSGGRESMPGMLDTVLNLGLNDESVAGLAKRAGKSCFRR